MTRTQVAATRSADADAFVATLDDAVASQAEVAKAASAMGVEESCVF